MHAVRRKLRGIDILRHAHENFVHGHKRDILFLSDLTNGLVETAEEGTEPLLVPHLERIRLNEKELRARREYGIDEGEVVGTESLRRDFLPARETAPNVIDTDFKHHIIGIFIHDILFYAFQKFCSPLSAYAAIDKLEVGIGIEKTQFARRNLDISYA